MIGQTLSHYRIIEKLGSGGMGEVYVAEETGAVDGSSPMIRTKTGFPAGLRTASGLHFIPFEAVPLRFGRSVPMAVS